MKTDSRVNGRPIPVALWRRGLELIGAAALAFTLLGAESAPAPRLAFHPAPESRVRVLGRATIGDWECETSVIVARIEPGPRLEALTRRVLQNRVAVGAVIDCVPRSETRNPAPPFASIRIPVASLQPDKPGMRADLLRALRSDVSPEIVFLLTAVREITVLPRGPGELGRYRVTVLGNLTLAGRTRSLELAADIVQETPVRFRIVAAPAIRMADFDIVPPTAFFGLIRVEETVTVALDLTFVVADGASEQISRDPAQAALPGPIVTSRNLCGGDGKPCGAIGSQT